MIARLFLMNSS